MLTNPSSVVAKTSVEILELKQVFIVDFPKFLSDKKFCQQVYSYVFIVMHTSLKTIHHT